MDERILSALARVFVPESIAGGRSLSDVVRPDTPLTALGPIDEAWPLLIAALEELAVELPNVDVSGVVTVLDLERLVGS